MSNSEVQQKVSAELETQLHAHLPKQPAWPLTPLRSCQPIFVSVTGKYVVQLRAEAVRTQPGPDTPDGERRRHERLLRGIQVVDALLEVRARAEEELNRAVVAHEFSPSGKLVYAPAAHQAGGVLSRGITNLRTALTDSLTDGSDIAREIRTLCGVGESLGGSPVDVRDLAQRQLLALRGPPPADDADTTALAAQAQQRRAYAEANGIDLEGYLEELEDGVAALNAALQRAPAQRVTSREARDRAQLRLELTCLRIIAAIHGLLGLEARDALRDILPKATYGQRRQDRKTEESVAAPSREPAARTVTEPGE